MSGGSLIVSGLDKDQDTGVYQCTAANTWGAVLSRRASLRFACKCLRDGVRASVSGRRRPILRVYTGSSDLWLLLLPFFFSI